MNQPDKLVIFDYSGTLSLEAPQFGRPESLACAFRESGLFSLGVTTPNFFWEEIVGPTWVEGSTTAIGYKRVMAKRIAALDLTSGKTGPEIAAAASRFVDGYLAHSRIDPHWRPVLEKLALGSGTASVIATDHYAEITEIIARYLRFWKLPVQKADAGALTPGRSAPFVVACSADMGFWKADRRFWEVLKSKQALERVRSILIIDDFGFNEEIGDLYRERARVEARQEETLSALKKAFGAEVQAIPFLLEGPKRQEAAAFIAETGERILQWTGRAQRRMVKDQG
jgi:hypothetical protein